MNQKAHRFAYRALVICLLGLWGFALASAASRDGQNRSGSLSKPNGTPRITILNINNFTSFLRADGQGNHQVDDQSGGRYPAGAATAIYEDGFVWGGKTYLDAGLTQPSGQLIRVGGQTYNQGTREGWVVGTGANATQTLPADPRARVYRIRRDYYFMSEADLKKDAAQLNLVNTTDVTSTQMDEVKQQYATDWTNWPVDLGAPYIERNGRAGYQAPPAFGPNFTTDSLVSGRFDEPGVAGADPNSPADQVVWTVYNDLDRSATFGLYQSEPLGLEGQVTMWGYKRADALGNLYFRRIKIINKGGVIVNTATGQRGSFYIDSMYISQWSDPDLGDSGDDLCGSDTLLSLGFAYNGNPVDAEYRKFSLPPPAVGYDFLQGPLVAGAPGDSGVFNLKRVYGKKNLPMTAFVYFSAGSPISDPRLTGQTGASYESTLKWWRMLRGYRPDESSVPTRRYPFPPGVTPGPFALTGDPVTRSGFYDGLGVDFSLAPGDRRIILASGPFSLAPGDTQEVVVGTVAGLGSDRLSSISVMKFNDRFVQNTYGALFAVPKAPKTPDVKYTELDGHVVFEWGSNLTRVSDIEETVSQPGSYAFEGYNVYQLPTASSPITAGRRIATYDLTTDPTVVLDLQFDEVSGQILQKPVQFGTNSGITRYYDFRKDFIRDIPRLNNGSEYYVAVTAYSVSRGGYLPVSLESTPWTSGKGNVIPHSPDPGVRFSTGVDSGLIVAHATGIGDATTSAMVIDPAQVTGQPYTVGFVTQPDGFEGHFISNQTDEQGNAYVAYRMDVNLVLNQAGNAATYTVNLTNIDSLYSPIAFPNGLTLQDSAGTTIFKNIPWQLTVVAGLNFATASGNWSSTDATQPLTPALVQQLIAGRMFFNVQTAAAANAVKSRVTILTYPYYIKRGTQTVLTYQQNYTNDNTYPIIDGLQFKISGPVFRAPTLIGGWTQTVKANPNTNSFKPVSGGTGGYTAFSGIVTDLASEAWGSGSAVTLVDLIQDLELRFTGVRINNAAEDTVIISGGSIATVYPSNFSADSCVRLRIPFELWENDPNGRQRQINVTIRDRNADASHPSPWGNTGRPRYMRIAYGRAYIQAVSTPYDSSMDPSARLPMRSNPRGTWTIVPRYAVSATAPASNSHWDTGDVVHLLMPNPMLPQAGGGVDADTYTFTAPAAVAYSAAAAKADVSKVNVFPNPYYAFNPQETSRTVRFVTFNHLPPKATIRIFNLAGQLVRTILKDSPSQYQQWDLANEDNFPVASGMYIVHVDMPDVGATKVLKVAVIQEQEVPNNF